MTSVFPCETWRDGEVKNKTMPHCMRYALWFTDQSILVGAGIQDKDLPRNQNLLFYAGYPPHHQGWKHTSFRSIFYLFPMLYTVLSPSFRATAMAPYEYHQLHKILLQMLMLVAAEKKGVVSQAGNMWLGFARPSLRQISPWGCLLVNAELVWSLHGTMATYPPKEASLQGRRDGDALHSLTLPPKAFFSCR